jgi:hypothetical protein
MDSSSENVGESVGGENEGHEYDDSGNDDDGNVEGEHDGSRDNSSFIDEIENVVGNDYDAEEE